MPELRDATVTIGVPGLNGGGVTTMELNAAVADLAPDDAKYIVQTADGDLSAEQALGALGTGILKNTTTTGVLSIATGSDLPAHTSADVVTGLAYLIDGGGSEIADGIHGPGLRVPFAATITGVTALADQSGSIVVDVWKDSLANYPPTNADSITASAPITISSDTDSEDTTLTGWTTSITAGDILRFNVDSATTIESLSINFTVTRTV